MCKLCVCKLCVSKLCVSKLCVCVQVVCVCKLYVCKLCVRRREAGGRRRTGYRTENKNPTQRCGEERSSDRTFPRITFFE